MISDSNHNTAGWIALSIGNSRLHWAWFQGEVLHETWDTAHLSAAEVKDLTCLGWANENFPSRLFNDLTQGSESVPELWIASVVPSQAALWQTYPNTRVITLDQVPLEATYPTLGIDRALAVWGAGHTQGWPVLVIDAGTALTFTGADANRRLVGGAILPGLGLQARLLAQSTVALEQIALPDHLPPRWARTTAAAVQSGILYTLIAGVRDFVTAWDQAFLRSKIIFTGGDRAALLNYLSWTAHPQPAWMTRLVDEPHAIFWGISHVRHRLEAKR